MTRREKIEIALFGSTLLLGLPAAIAAGMLVGG